MNTAVSASGKPNIAEELVREAYNSCPELDPTKNRGLLDEFSRCVSADDIMLVLEKQITALKDFKNDRWAKLREKLKPVVEVALLVTKVVGDSAQSIGIPGDKGLFTAFGLLLAATQTQSKSYDTLERLLERLGAFLFRFKVLYEGSASHHRFGLDQISINILAHLFQVLALATKFLKKGRFRHYLSALRSFPDDLKEALQKMDDLAKEEHMMIAAHTLVAVELLPPSVESIGEDVEDFKKGLQNFQRVQVDDIHKKWLAAPDPATDRNDALSRRQAGTGDWFLHTEAFQKWRTSSESTVLWLHGQSGSGKTVISACVVHNLLAVMPDLAYFFFVMKSGEKENINGMLSSILIQLATLSERHKILCDAYDSDKHIGTPSRSSLLTYFERMLAVPGDLVFVIDALDEHPAPRDELLRFFSKLSCDHHNRLRILVTSRNESDIRTAMEDMHAIEVDLSEAPEQKNDIQTYITSALAFDEPFRSWSVSHPRILGLIKGRLIQERMFRLVSLQLDRLRLTTPIDVEQTLNTLPHSLMEMYEYILQSMASKNENAIRRIMHVFEIISCASRPLTVDEVAEVFAVEFDNNNNARVLEDHRLKNPEIDLLRTCTSTFIQIKKRLSRNRPNRPYVSFAHASVLDYLQRNPDAAPVSVFRINDANSAITLTKLCLCTVHSMIKPSDSERPRGPFDDCAHRFWLKETTRALLLKPVDVIKPLLDSILLQKRERIPAHLAEYFSYPSFASPLCCASHLGQQDYVQQIFRSSTSDVDLISTGGWTPLHYAACKGHINTVQTLIEHKASLDKEDKHGKTPLHIAIKNGYLDIVQILIEHSASVDKRDEDGQTPLHYVASGGHIDIVQTLIEHGASLDKKDKHGQTLLHLATGNGYLNIVLTLIGHGASVDKGDIVGQTPIHYAASGGHIDIIQTLARCIP